MPAVTQRIDNYLGGVSRQSDDKKKPGQVRECLNAFPDPTFGLTKRPGLKWIKNIGTGTSLDSARWFYIHRDNDEKYIGCIKPSSIAVSGNGTSGATNKTNVAATSSGGSGMTVDLTASGGVVTAITLNTPGKGYLNGETITIASATAGTGSNVTGTLTLGDIKIWNGADGTECSVHYDARDDQAWQASTLYEVGDYVTNDSGKLYKCTRKGMSNSSGGPTGTNTDIEYLTAWAANTSYSVGDKRVANGRVYRCDAAGFSDKATSPWSGPSTTDADIVDPNTLDPWAPRTPYVVGDLVRNDSGKVYKCDVAGTSGDQTGPSGTSDDQEESSSNTNPKVRWDYEYNYARWDYQEGSNGAARWDYIPRVGRTYLQGIRDNLNTLTVQDTSIITNDRWTISALTAPTYLADSQATLVFSGVLASSKFNVQITVAGTTYNILEYTASSTASYSDIINAIRHRIDRLGHGPPQTQDQLDNLNENLMPGFSAGVEYDTTIQLSSTKSFTISARGGLATDLLVAFQDQVANVTQLPSKSKHGHLVKVINTSSSADSYWAEFVADDGTSGTGHWKESRDPSVSAGLDAATMPHELINLEKNRFIFRQITWTDRLVGDDVTNEHPSFVGKKIKQAFFHKNRLGFLSEDNVSMSRSGEFYNLYHRSAQTLTAADPVDLSCATIRPAVLHGVLPTPQGLVLFSQNQQFLMSATEGLLTPTGTSINAISNFEMATDIAPIDMGTNVNFVSKTPNYSRVYGMNTRGQEESPTVLDVGRVVNEWIPETIDTLTGSPQNSLIVLSSQSSDMAYLYRTYSDGQRLLLQSWFRWQFSGDIQTTAVDNDEMFVVTKQASSGGQFTLSKTNLSQSPDDAILVTSTGDKVNPCMDLYSLATNVIYNSTNKFSKCYVPWDSVSALTPVILVKGTTTTGQYTESGVTYTADAVTESAWQASTAYAVGDSVTNDSGKVYVCDTAGTSAGSGGPTGTGANITDGTARWDFSVTPTTLNYFKVTGRDLTSEASNIYVGWKYDFDVTLPKTYFYLKDKSTDYTASLTIARMKFAVGLSGAMSFKLKSTGRLPAEKLYTADGTTTVFKWFKDEIPYVDKDQIKVKINDVESTAFTAGDDQITLTAASSELRTLSGNGSLKSFDLTYTPRDVSKVRVTIGGVATTAFNIVKNFINFDSAPASGSSNILVYSADDILVYLDEWYNINPIIDYNTYLANDTSLTSESIVTIPIHQKSNNFQLRVWNDTPFPVALNSMMWEGSYSPRFYRRT